MSQSVVIGLKIAFVDFEDVFLELPLISRRYIFLALLTIGHFQVLSTFT